MMRRFPRPARKQAISARWKRRSAWIKRYNRMYSFGHIRRCLNGRKRWVAQW